MLNTTHEREQEREQQNKLLETAVDGKVHVPGKGQSQICSGRRPQVVHPCYGAPEGPRKVAQGTSEGGCSG